MDNGNEGVSLTSLAARVPKEFASDQETEDNMVKTYYRFTVFLPPISCRVILNGYLPVIGLPDNLKSRGLEIGPHWPHSRSLLVGFKFLFGEI